MLLRTSPSAWENWVVWGVFLHERKLRLQIQLANIFQNIFIYFWPKLNKWVKALCYGMFLFSDIDVQHWVILAILILSFIFGQTSQSANLPFSDMFDWILSSLNVHLKGYFIQKLKCCHLFRTPAPLLARCWANTEPPFGCKTWKRRNKNNVAEWQRRDKFVE